MVDINEEMKMLIYCLLKSGKNDEITIENSLIANIPKHFEIIARRNYQNETTTYKIQEYLR